MTFSVKNKFVSLGGGSFVEDDNGNRLFKVKGKMFSPTRKENSLRYKTAKNCS